jgi:sporulation and spore germination protein
VRRLAAAVAVALLAAACRQEGLTILRESELPVDVYGSPRPTPTETSDVLPKEGKVYLVKHERLQARSRPLQAGSGVAGSLPEALLLALIQPPQGRKLTTAIPADTRLNEVQIQGTIVTVDLSAEFETAAPQGSQALRIAQVVYTLTQDGTGILGVRFAIDGILRNVIGGERLTQLDHPATRFDYRQFAPPGEQP